MPSRTAQGRITKTGALLAVVLGAGWGCAQLISADFDRPSQTSGSGGSVPSGSSGSSGSSGGDMASAGSGGSSGAMSSSGSGGADAGCMKLATDDDDCGPLGKDIDCDGVVGDCDSKAIYVWLKGGSTLCDLASDAIITDQKGNPGGGFYQIAEFRVFDKLLPGTTALYNCGAGTHPKVTITSASNPCVGVFPDPLPLGYVSNMSAGGYEQLSKLTLKDGNAFVVAPASAQMNNPCCHASPCGLIDYYVLPK